MLPFRKFCLLLYFIPAFLHAAPDPSFYAEKLKPIAAQALSFAKARGFNTDVCFLIDLSLHSGKNRFFVYHPAKNMIVDQGLVAHGHCHQMIQKTVQFSNVPGCACSSSGKYKVGREYVGQFGTAFKLAGLEKTNSNAERRAIVLHAHPCIPETERYPQAICRSEGCTTVSPNFLKRLGKLIRASDKPILLWVFQ